MELGGLLRAVWLSGTLLIVVASLPFSSLGSFHRAVSGLANRGQTVQSSPRHKFTVPKRLFYHFYAVAVVWTTLLLLMTWIYAYTTAPLALHVMRRLLETLYILKYSRSARMHIIFYLAATSFYIAAPLSLCCSCAPEAFQFGANKVAEFIVKGKGEMVAIEFDWWDFVNPLLKLGWCQWIGAAICIWGSIHQHRCHTILGAIRERKQDVDKYAIPHGDWFEIVSSPHYLADIVIYAGLLFASGGTDLTIWLLLGIVVANLAFVAAETHRWYLRKFDNYPSNRFAIIPFVC